VRVFGFGGIRDGDRPFHNHSTTGRKSFLSISQEKIDREIHKGKQKNVVECLRV
jgi:hypothetical protein